MGHGEQGLPAFKIDKASLAVEPHPDPGVRIQPHRRSVRQLHYPLLADAGRDRAPALRPHPAADNHQGRRAHSRQTDQGARQAPLPPCPTATRHRRVQRLADLRIAGQLAGLPPDQLHASIGVRVAGLALPGEKVLDILRADAARAEARVPGGRFGLGGFNPDLRVGHVTPHL
jgi:hypothetical protein